MGAKLRAVVALAACSIAVGIAGESAAFTLAGLSRDFSKLQQSAFLPERSQTVGPFAHALFCTENPRDCKVTRRTRWGRAPLPLSAKRMQELRTVNKKVNAEIVARNDDKSIDFGDKWTLAPKAGDCDDYAVTKRHELVRLGWPERAVRLAITFTASGEGHMVLVVKTNKGDLVLDNRVGTIRPWNKTGLKWKMVQSSNDPRKWLSV